ncbi:MAG: GlsB/YeaQ/YmgE family stress response membrane protein [Planctomycetaceae bacterium]
MTDPDLMLAIEQGIHELLVWVGFGTLVGLAAKAIMPGRDPGGTVATLMMGIVGCVIGCGTLMFFRPEAKVSPISPLGFLCSTLGGFLILLMYRVMAGSIFPEAEAGDSWLHKLRRRRRSRRIADSV